jgi:adenylate cyclase
MFVLIGQSGPLAGQEVVVKDQMIFGRNPECDQEVRDANASRRHCRFTMQGNAVAVFDLNSFNGTFVNEEKIQGKRDLKHGDVVRIGESRFLLQQKGQPAAAPPKKPESLGALGRTLFGFSDTVETASESVMTMSQAAIGKGANASQLEKRLQAVLRMSEALGTLRSTEEVFQKLLDCLFEVFPQAARGFLLLGNDIASLKPVSTRNKHGQDTGGKVDISRSIVGRALREKSAVLFSEGADGFKNNVSIVALEIRSAMVIPLVVKDEVLGILSIDTDNPLKQFTSDDLAIASAAAGQASVALKNALLNEKIEGDAIVRQNLCRFLPGPLAAQAMEGKLDLKLGGQKVKGTIFFSDVVGFTTMSETLPPDALVAVLNAYFDLMVNAISDNHGAIDKYLGDAIMAFWGIPMDEDGMGSTNACIAGLQMQNALWTFNYQLKSEGKPKLAHGLGINTGEVVAGNIGSSRRVEYTVIGDNVNLAQRLESRAAGGQVLISESTFQDTQGRALGIKLAPSKVKGKNELVSPMSLRGVVRTDSFSLAHVPLLMQDGTPIVISGVTKQANGAINLTIIHPEGHQIPNGMMVRPDLAEMPDSLPFGLKILNTQPVAEGEQEQIRYNLSIATPLNWEPRLQQIFGDRKPVQGNLDLDSIKRH